MSIGFSSAARNLFLLGSTGAAVVTNFFKTVDRSAGTDGVYLPDEIKYNFADQKFVLAGSAQDSTSKRFGWFEKRNQAGSAEWDVRVEALSAGVNTTLRAMELDSNDNLIVVGKTGTVPWIAKYSNGGVIDWQSTTNSGDVEYTGVTSDSNGQYYACGSTPVSGEATAFVEKFDEFGVPGWGKSAFVLGRDVVLSRISANSRGEVVAVGYLEDDSSDKGYIIKIDTNTGEVLWDRTLEVFTETSGAKQNLWCQDVYIDSNDQIYVVGRIGDGTEIRSFLIKYTAEGNIIWQKETPREERIEYFQVKSDGETEQTVVFGVYVDPVTSDQRGIISKYSKNGDLVWRRVIFSSDTVIDDNSFGQITASSRPLGSYVSLDADPSFYYVLFIDTTVFVPSETPQQYTFGKISSSGNGLGDFQYADGTGEIYNYEILNVQDKIGRISDGSVRQDTSDLITYPYNATYLLFDDLATQVSNKKRQMDSPDSFEYSGSPAIRPADFQELNLLGDNVSGRIWNDTSGKGNNGVARLTEPFFGAGSTSFDGSSGYFTMPDSEDFNIGSSDFTIELWLYKKNTSTYQHVFRQRDSGSAEMAIVLDIDSTGGDSFASGYFQMEWGANKRFVGVNAGLTNDTWHHLALTKEGTTGRVFVDGVLVGTDTLENVGNYSGDFYVGYWEGGLGYYFSGYMSDFRIVKGTALYTSNFTPPTTQLTNIPGTVLLTCQGDSIVDDSPSSHPITITGSVAPTDDGPTYNAAGYWEFDGVDDYIDFTNPGLSNEFSLEAWVRPTNFPANNLEDNGIFGTTTNAIRCQFDFNEGPTPGTNTNLRFFDSGLIPNGLESTLNVSDIINTWSHVCVTRSGTTTTIYLDGSVLISGTQTGSANSNLITKIGTASADGPQYFEGDIGEARIYPRTLTAAQVFQNYNATKSKYLNEPPDTAPKIGPGIVYDSNLLLNYDFGNRATYDRAENLLLNSNDLNSTYWEIGGGQGFPTRTQDALSPVGDLTAWTVDDTATGADGQGMDANISGLTASSTQTYTMSVYAKQGTAAKFDMYCFFKPTIRGTRLTYTWSDNQIFAAGSDNGGAAPVSSGQEYVGNGWYRIWMEVVDSTLGTNTEIEFRLYPASRDTGPTGSTLFWNPQVVKGSDPGRYIKTYGTAITAPTTVKNLSSSSYTGNIVGATFNPAGYFEFDGTNGDKITVGSIGDWNFLHNGSTDWTMEYWIYVDLLSDRRTIFSTGGNSSVVGISSRVMESGALGSSDGTLISVQISRGVGGNYLYWDSSPSNITNNTWYHISLVFNSSSKSLGIYLNSQLTNGSSDTGAVAGTFGSGDYSQSNSYSNLEFGGDSFTGSSLDFDGRMEEVRIYNRALTATEVSQNFNVTRSKYGV